MLVTWIAIMVQQKDTFEDDVFSWLRDEFCRFLSIELVLGCTADISDKIWMSSSMFNIRWHVGSLYLAIGGYVGTSVLVQDKI